MKNLWVLVNFAVIATMLCIASIGQAQEHKAIRKATPLSYPTVARLAQIQGEIKLALEIDSDGHIVSVSKINGPDSLAVVAAKEIKEWRYTASDQLWRATLVILYLLEKPLLPSAPVARVTIRTPFDISVTSNYPLPTGNPETMSPK
jgi:Gram-negative bacterial TonB protein C-terminal